MADDNENKLNKTLDDLEDDFKSLSSIADSVRNELRGLRDSVKELQRMQSTVTTITSDLKSPLLSAVVRFAQGNEMQSKLVQVQEKKINVLQKEILESDAAIAVAQQRHKVSKEELDRLTGNDEESLAQKAKIEMIKKSSETLLKEKTTVESRVQELQDEISTGKLSRKQKKQVKKELEAQQSILQQLNEEYYDNIDQLEALKEELAELDSSIERSKLTEEEKAKRIKELNDTINKEMGIIEENVRNREQLGKDLEEEHRKLKQLDIQKTARALSDLNKIFRALVDPVRKTQQAFGITAGLAAGLNITNTLRSVESFFDSAMSGFQKAAVTGVEIQQAQQAFFQEFGGVITSDAAKELVMQAKTLGITSGELAKARRVFMTQTMGDLTEAREQQDRIIASFKEQGLTTRDAMQAIAQYSEIAARMGIRFQQSFAEAAADAKKIGVDLNKVNQVGDNIIGNFESFLESMAELGAMGFGFDSTRLAEIAETGDTGALFDELRSQLQGMGKDITNLRRSEQLALSSAFGLNIEEFQRLASGEEGSGETMVDQQKEGNSLLKTLTGVVEAANIATAALALAQVTLLTIIAKNTAVDAATDILGAIKGLGTYLAPLKFLGRFAGVTTGVGLGIAGSMGAYTAAQEGSLGGSVMGILTSTAGGALTGATVGGVQGALIGGGIGLVTGIGSAIAGSYNADDMISKSGYGERTLVTPEGPIALNNEDNIIAYADDMLASEAGIQVFNKGELAPTPTDVSVNTAKMEEIMERNLRGFSQALRSAQLTVNLNGEKVAKGVVLTERNALTSGLFSEQRVSI